MSNTTTISSAPTLAWRVAIFWGIWLIMFGVIIAITTLPKERNGIEIMQEGLMAILMAPFIGWVGVTTVIGGSQPSLPTSIISFLVIFAPTAMMLLRCRTIRAFWTLTTVHIIVVTISGIAFIQVCSNP